MWKNLIIEHPCPVACLVSQCQCLSLDVVLLLSVVGILKYDVVDLISQGKEEHCISINDDQSSIFIY